MQPLFPTAPPLHFNLSPIIFLNHRRDCFPPVPLVALTYQKELKRCCFPPAGTAQAPRSPPPRFVPHYRLSITPPFAPPFPSPTRHTILPLFIPGLTPVPLLPLSPHRLSQSAPVAMNASEQNVLLSFVLYPQLP